MEKICWYVFEILATCFETLIILNFAKEFLGKKVNGKKFIMGFWIFWLLFSLLVTAVNSITEFESFGAVLYSTIVFIFCLLYLNGSIPIKFIVSLIPIVSIIIVNSVVATAVSTICGEGLENLIYQQSIYRTFTVVITKFLLYYLLLVIQKVFEKEKKFSMSFSEWISIITTFLISTAVFTIIDLINIENKLNEMGKILALFGLLCLVILNIVSFYMIVRLSRTNYIESENKLLKLQNEYQAHYVENIKLEEKEIKTIRHDLKHNLFVIEAQLKQGKIEETQKYISTLLHQQVFLGGTVCTDNETVNAIINSKIIYAKSVGINVFVQSSKYIINIDDIDLCNLLGNLLDNAIEACEKITSNERYIKIQISADNDMMTLSIKNSIEKSVLKNNSKLLTSKKDSSKHGFGFTSVNHIVNKYNGKLDIYESPDNMFCVTVILRTD